MIDLNDNAELVDVENLIQGKDFCIRTETLLRKWFQSTKNLFGNACVKTAGTAAGNIAILGTNGLLIRARWAASFAASLIIGILNITRIPNLSASKVISGQFQITQIPSLNAANNFDSGMFTARQLPASPSTPAYTIATNATVTRGSGNYYALGTYSANISGNSITFSIQTTGASS